MTHKERFNQFSTASPYGITSLTRMAVAWRSSLFSLAEFADGYRFRFSQKIGDDGVIGKHWEDTMRGLHHLLDCDMGQSLDCPAASACINDMLKMEGFEL